ncbi:formate/nitrite transporter family protein [Reichenbachiella agarivorans]|uniref:Formate/nitrite transporter family protein n=1 Tax=Reichenbachiella agarivorans TaxID=2979464 RepID=A0ABY6CMG0_9BACT|nr:formate/nitrite transporter family protein [Reichenbachiella agarivorans]UXP31691.1 formate/nitrite transporter family protein [Reichenbachiella agarivorans]
MIKLFKNESAQPGQPKEVKEILEEQIETSLKEFNRSNIGLFMSAFTAGLEIGFSVLFMGTMLTLFGQDLSPNVMKLVLALCYPIGFIFVIIGRSELFTEHTALAILPVLRGAVRLRAIFLLWGLVYSGNLLGGFLFSILIAKIGPAVGFIEPSAFHDLAYHLVSYDWDVILLSALLAGWMMGLLGWLVTSSQETISRILVITMVTAIIGVAGLHHCIVGSIEVFTGMITSPDIHFTDYLHFQLWATLGNTLGGTFFVAILKFSHVRLKG